MRTTIIAVASMSALVSAHGNITSPPARLAGPGMAAAHRQQAVDDVSADGTIPLENITPTRIILCNLFLCRGATFDDNVDLVQTFTAGQVVDMTAILPIPHEGPCNVSVVDTATNTVIGDPPIEFDTYADETLDELPANNTAFSVTMPELDAGQCTVAGECVLQWFWFGTGAQQTYESCVDFVME